MEPADSDLVDDERITLWGLFIEAHHLISEQLDDDLREVFPYPEAWMEVLIRLARTPGSAMPMTKLAHMVLFSSGGFTKLADRMEAEGLIRRVACPTDRRSYLATLTPKGRRVLERTLRIHLPNLERRFLAHLDPEEIVQLEAILRRLRDAAAGPDHADLIEGPDLSDLHAV